jgi:hypothetical protein
MQGRRVGGGIPAVRNATPDHEALATAGKNFRARDIDATMERRGRRRELLLLVFGDVPTLR